MTDLYFVDSNILVYRRDASEPAKQPVAADWIERLWREESGRLSLQVLEEFYQVVTRKLSPGLPAGEARQEVRELFAWRPLALDSDVLERAWQMEELYSLSFWDAMIVAAAHLSGARTILSEDLAADQEYAGVRVVNPFA